MLARVVEDMALRGVRLARALTKTEQSSDARLLVQAGFRHVCELLYLVSLRASFPTAAPEDGLTFTPLAGDEQRLAAVVERTYEQSLDCPAIENVRPVGDVLAGYRATGEFDAARWLIVSREGTDIGCLLMATWPRNNQWELIYMGVAPEARGHGYGLAIVRQAQWLTAQAGCDRLVLAVDMANEPALNAYAAAGFIAWDRRSVFVTAT